MVLFKKDNDSEYKYSISKHIYDKFLFGKREVKGKEQAPIQNNANNYPKIEQSIPAEKGWELHLKEQNKYAQMLESKGYLVLSNNIEAAALSTLLEESIRQGHVLGTRSFNRRFYVGLRVFIAKNSSKILKTISNESLSVSQISKQTGIDEDGIRTILYLMAESGDVVEVRRDVFSIA